MRATPVAPNFVGLSIEVWSAGEYCNAKVAALLRQIRELTPGRHPGPVLRIGGNSVDSSCYVDDDADALPPSCAYRITRESLRQYAAFAQSAPDLNLSYVLGVNFGRSPSPELAAAHVAAIGRAGLWPLVSAVEVGNEQDHYARRTEHDQQAKGHRWMGYHYEQYSAELERFLAALRNAGLPERRVQGGTWTCSPGATVEEAPVACAGGFTGNLTAYLRKFSTELTSFSFHRYAASHCNGKAVSAAELLADHAAAGQAERLAPIAAATAALPPAGIDLVVGEVRNRHNNAFESRALPQQSRAAAEPCV
jgi:hypothetical protein